MVSYVNIKSLEAAQQLNHSLSNLIEPHSEHRINDNRHETISRQNQTNKFENYRCKYVADQVSGSPAEQRAERREHILHISY